MNRHRVAVPFLFLLLFAPLVHAQTRDAGTAVRNADLEQRLKAVVAKSSGVWGVSVKHIERNEFAGINAADKFQMASVFKVPVLVELFKQVKDGKISLEERVEWKDAPLYFGSGILVNLDAGLKLTFRDLATLMITLSDNAATDMICSRLGFANITARMRALGLAKTTVDGGTRDLILLALGLRGEEYRNVTRDTLRNVDWSGKAEAIQRNQKLFLDECPNCTTPEEMTSLFEKIATGQAAEKPATEQMLRILSQQQFNQRLPRWLPGNVRVEHKTGTLNGPVWVVNDAGIINLPGGQRVIVSVFSHGTDMALGPAELKASISNAEDRIGEIAKTVYDFYTAAPVK
ncbi:MAG TPA: serine hydrolase [Candidatus Acidoferrales bacterium]|nr:serine hydrolase [Candidatus Acidoferrales bacterium]